MNPKPDKKGQKTRGYPEYIRYSGLAIQLVATILIFVYAGNWLDKKMSLEKPWFTLLLSLVAVVGSMYRLIKGLSRKPERKS